MNENSLGPVITELIKKEVLTYEDVDYLKRLNLLNKKTLETMCVQRTGKKLSEIFVPPSLRASIEAEEELKKDKKKKITLNLKAYKDFLSLEETKNVIFVFLLIFLLGLLLG